MLHARQRTGRANTARGTARFVDEEDPAVTAAREAVEETGWKAEPLEWLCSCSADNGISDARFHLFRAAGATYQGPPEDTVESARVEWVPLASIGSLVKEGEIDDGATLAASLLLLAHLM